VKSKFRLLNSPPETPKSVKKLWAPGSPKLGEPPWENPRTKPLLKNTAGHQNPVFQKAAPQKRKSPPGGEKHGAPSEIYTMGGAPP